MAMKGEEPKLTKLAPHWSLDEVAAHAVDFWLTTEDLPLPDNRITVGESGVDDYGVPIARIEFKYRENERKMMTEMYQTAAAILKEAKAEILPYAARHGMPGADRGGQVHETARGWAARSRSASRSAGVPSCS